ncbi:MAG: 2-C-methyl-D-erythritol 4-phosphate cytidylyltransferase [Burkholderiales bacterium]|nr:2-C-methyl-D-erythritol 4-phosphate cytidylyltransferase [Burkholderiales bacterium]
MTESTQQNITAIILAAGSGTRMGDSSPKQHRVVAGKSLIQHSIDAFLAEPRINKVILVVSPSDIVAQKLVFDDPRVVVARVGGPTRDMSVKNALSYAAFTENEWVLVHDAARPCVLTSDISKLMDECIEQNCGGILAVRVNDALKKAGKNMQVVRSISRDNVWAAQTPQMFRAFDLLEALEEVEDYVDESSAMEAKGAKPLIVEGTPTNIKVTYPMDFWMAHAILNYRASLDEK